MESFDYSEKEQDRLFEGIYLGIIGLAFLPKKLYAQTAKVLKSALYKGYGNIEFGTPDQRLLKELRENIYIFSGAKTATQVEDIKSLMYEGDKLLSLTEFKKVAKVRFDTYNGKDGYLESEYITAQTTASSARVYKDALADKETFLYLTSHAIIDSFTAPECERMNKVTARVEDPIWNHNLAARHFRCRCYEEKSDRYGDVKLTSDNELKTIIEANDKNMSPLFKFNPVKDKIIFSDQHSYYEIGKANPELAKKNFNLPIPKKDAK